MSKKEENKKRDILPDVIRGFAILLVVIGHCIQEGNGSEFSVNMLYFDDKLYQFIYSFHMPLFALIAGYYAFISVKKQNDWAGRRKLLVRKILTYGIPIIFWTLTEYIREVIINTKYGFVTYTPVNVVTGFILRVINNHWFLWSMIVCFVIVWIMHYCLRDNWIIYLLGYLALFFIPDGMNLHAYKYLMPFYIVAFYISSYVNQQAKNDLYEKIFDFYKNKNLQCLMITGIIFAILFVFYRRDAFIYVSGYRITKNIWWKQILIDIYRMIIGFAGSMFFICLWKRIIMLTKSYTYPVMRAFGSNSLGVYVLSGYMTILVMKRYTDPLGYSIPRVMLESAFVAIVALVISILLGRIPVVKKIVGK